MLTKIKNFVKRAFKKVKEVIMNTAETVIDIVKENKDTIIDAFKKPTVKTFTKIAVPSTLILNSLIFAYCMVKSDVINREYYERERSFEKFRRDTDMKYSIDIQ